MGGALPSAAKWELHRSSAICQFEIDVQVLFNSLSVRAFLLTKFFFIFYSIFYFIIWSIYSQLDKFAILCCSLYEYISSYLNFISVTIIAAQLFSSQVSVFF